MSVGIFESGLKGLVFVKLNVILASEFISCIKNGSSFKFLSDRTVINIGSPLSDLSILSCSILTNVVCVET